MAIATEITNDSNKLTFIARAIEQFVKGEVTEETPAYLIRHFDSDLAEVAQHVRTMREFELDAIAEFQTRKEFNRALDHSTKAQLYSHIEYIITREGIQRENNERLISGLKNVRKEVGRSGKATLHNKAEAEALLGGIFGPDYGTQLLTDIVSGLPQGGSRDTRIRTFILTVERPAMASYRYTLSVDPENRFELKGLLSAAIQGVTQSLSHDAPRLDVGINRNRSTNSEQETLAERRAENMANVLDDLSTEFFDKELRSPVHESDPTPSKETASHDQPSDQTVQDVADEENAYAAQDQRLTDAEYESDDGYDPHEYPDDEVAEELGYKKQPLPHEYMDDPELLTFYMSGLTRKETEHTVTLRELKERGPQPSTVLRGNSPESIAESHANRVTYEEGNLRHATRLKQEAQQALDAITTRAELGNEYAFVMGRELSAMPAWIKRNAAFVDSYATGLERRSLHWVDDNADDRRKGEQLAAAVAEHRREMEVAKQQGRDLESMSSWVWVDPARVEAYASGLQEKKLSFEKERKIVLSDKTTTSAQLDTLNNTGEQISELSQEVRGRRRQLVSPEAPSITIAGINANSTIQRGHESPAERRAENMATATLINSAENEVVAPTIAAKKARNSKTVAKTKTAVEEIATPQVPAAIEQVQTPEAATTETGRTVEPNEHWTKWRESPDTMPSQMAEQAHGEYDKWAEKNPEKAASITFDKYRDFRIEQSKKKEEKALETAENEAVATGAPSDKSWRLQKGGVEALSPEQREQAQTDLQKMIAKDPKKQTDLAQYVSSVQEYSAKDKEMGKAMLIAKTSLEQRGVVNLSNGDMAHHFLKTAYNGERTGTDAFSRLRAETEPGTAKSITIKDAAVITFERSANDKVVRTTVQAVEGKEETVKRLFDNAASVAFRRAGYEPQSKAQSNSRSKDDLGR